MPELSQDLPGTDLLTLRLDSTSQAHFDQMRQQYFPAERNLIAAHLTLFHTLPRAPEIASVLETAAAQTATFILNVTGLQSLGGGVAYKLEAAELMRLHRVLSESFDSHLSNQDRQKFRPHVVIQNKVGSARAKTLLSLLQAGFHGFDVQAEGLDLWHYCGGPWKHVKTFPFTR